MKQPREGSPLPIVEGTPEVPRVAADTLHQPKPPNQPARPHAEDARDGAAPRHSGADAASPTSVRDLEDGDLHPLLTAFYGAVEQEPLLAPYFAVVDMEAHMPRIVDFWSTLLWHTGRYSGNAFRPHMEMAGLTGEHFARWLATLERTVDTRFAGPSAENMKSLGHRIAYSMQVRLGITPFEEYMRSSTGRQDES